ncbi:toxin [Streptomyces spongiicola]|uniref:Toxin n=1 Tax=Streptomyces spongiicola TaxID=1690221 RepID=A0A388T8A4_9ACTN|nr:toxin [Streptomyces spongiicola]
MSTAVTSPVQPVLAWFRSSYSGAEGGQCVEVAWRKSSYSGAEGGDCVEVAATPGTVHVRDSKQLGGPVLSVSPRAWAGLVELAAEHSA